MDSDEHRDAFSLFDKQGDGKVECGEIGDMLRAFGLNPTEAEVKKIIADIDPTGQKRVTFEEFLPLYHTHSKKKSSGNFESFAEGFRIFDRDNNGMVSVAEIRHLLTSLGEKLSSGEVDMLVQGMEDSNGMINYEGRIRQIKRKKKTSKSKMRRKRDVERLNFMTKKCNPSTISRLPKNRQNSWKLYCNQVLRY